jgi:hypothetical protein
MNWSFLHTGPAGVAEAALIALMLGLVAFACFHRLARRWGWPEGRALGWACLLALLGGGGVDFFHLLRLFMADATYPARVRLALQGIHDPEWLGVRFLAEALCALLGAVVGWAFVEARGGRSPER